MHWYVYVESQSYGPYSDDQMRGFVAEGRITPSSLISNAPQSGFFGATEFDAYNLWTHQAQQDMLMSVAATGNVAVQATTRNYAPIQPVQPAKEQAIQQNIQQFAPQQAQEPSTQLEPIELEPSQTYASISTDYEPVVQPTARPKSGSEKKQIIERTQSCIFLVLAEISSNGEMDFLKALQAFGQAERVGDTVWLVKTTHSVEHIRNILSQTLNQQDRLFILNSKAGKPAWFNIGTDLDHRLRKLWDEGEEY